MPTLHEDHRSWGLREFDQRYPRPKEPLWFKLLAIVVWVSLFVWALVSR